MKVKLTVIALTAGLATMPGASKIVKEPVTFSKDVAPILQKNCQSCHRPGEAAPMSLLTYQETRPWAAAIREAVILKRMPPWYADSHFGKFSNDRSLSKADIHTLVSWANTGTPAGDSKKHPNTGPIVAGWNVGR